MSQVPEKHLVRIAEIVSDPIVVGDFARQTELSRLLERSCDLLSASAKAAYVKIVANGPPEGGSAA